jgi:hypothetical protein
LNIESAAAVTLDAFPQAHVAGNPATDPSGDNIVGSNGTG